MTPGAMAPGTTDVVSAANSLVGSLVAALETLAPTAAGSLGSGTNPVSNNIGIVNCGVHMPTGFPTDTCQ
jgi:hypothetical protein